MTGRPYAINMELAPDLNLSSAIHPRMAIEAVIAMIRSDAPATLEAGRHRNQSRTISARLTGRSDSLYDAMLAALAMPRCVTGDPEWDRIAAGWGLYEDGGIRELGFWIGKPFNQQTASSGNGTMVAFSARSWKAGDDFHAAALAHGGTCDGPPGLRLNYSPDFYAAYVRDLDGNKLAAVCRGFTKRP